MAKEYEVIGPREIDGNAPGSTFKADLPEEKEASLIDAGHIRVKPAANGGGKNGNGKNGGK
jgi:hypothetical protein